MKIGIISDTHDNIKITKRACDLFMKHGVEMVIHAGDFASREILDLFREFNCKFVYGNADINIDRLNEKCKEIGIDCLSETCEIIAEEKRILVMHGNVIKVFRDAVASGNYDYIIKGHTHHFENYLSNNTRVINPGSAFGTKENSIAVLDTYDDSVEKILI